MEQSILTSIKVASPSEEINPNSSIEEKLNIGKPLVFSLTEKYSFEEWLQLSKIHPIVRENISLKEEKINQLIQ